MLQIAITGLQIAIAALHPFSDDGVTNSDRGVTNSDRGVTPI